VYAGFRMFEANLSGKRGAGQPAAAY